MAVDGNVAAIVGSSLTFAGIVATAYFADRRAKRNADLERARLDAQGREAQQQAAKADSSTAFAQNIELNEYVDKRIADKTAELRRDVADLKRALGWMHRWVQRIRRAITEYMRDVELTWPAGASHPPPSAHILELLDEENLDDTLTNDIVRRMSADSHTDPAAAAADD
jgi:hypothetical protein